MSNLQEKLEKVLIENADKLKEVLEKKTINQEDVMKAFEESGSLGLTLLIEDMIKKFKANWIKIRGGCPMVTKVAQLISYINSPLVNVMQMQCNRAKRSECPFKRQVETIYYVFVKTKRNESCENKRSIAWSNYFSSRDQ